jgi:hypothetical protein
MLRWVWLRRATFPFRQQLKHHLNQLVNIERFSNNRLRHLFDLRRTGAWPVITTTGGILPYAPEAYAAAHFPLSRQIKIKCYQINPQRINDSPVLPYHHARLQLHSLRP